MGTDWYVLLYLLELTNRWERNNVVQIVYNRRGCSRVAGNSIPWTFTRESQMKTLKVR